MLDGGEAGHEDQETHHGGGKEPGRVEAKPGKVYGHLLPQVVSDVVQRLVFVPHPPPRPIFVQDLSRVRGTVFLPRTVETSLVRTDLRTDL